MVFEHRLALLGITADGEGFVAEPPGVDAFLAAVLPLRHLLLPVADLQITYALLWHAGSWQTLRTLAEFDTIG